MQLRWRVRRKPALTLQPIPIPIPGSHRGKIGHGHITGRQPPYIVIRVLPQYPGSHPDLLRITIGIGDQVRFRPECPWDELDELEVGVAVEFELTGYIFNKRVEAVKVRTLSPLEAASFTDIESRWTAHVNGLSDFESFPSEIWGPRSPELLTDPLVASSKPSLDVDRAATEATRENNSTEDEKAARCVNLDGTNNSSVAGASAAQDSFVHQGLADPDSQERPSVLVVDGSNIAFAGRQKSGPSFAQLQRAVSKLGAKYPDSSIIVGVDANFPTKINPSELAAFTAACDAGEVKPAPAGATGRGDRWVCEIAEEYRGHGARVILVTNDSYRELQGTFPWLLDDEIALGGTALPEGAGFVFAPRSMVRAKPTSQRPREI